MTRSITPEVEEKIARWEGEVLYAYDDFDPKIKAIKKGMAVRGTLTIGIGHTGPDVVPGMTITREQSRDLFRRDIDRFEAAVDRLVKVPVSDNQFGTLVSFAFNVGIDAFSKSTLLKKLNAGEYAAVPGQLARWVHSKGERMPGLVNRRAAEAGLWAKGEFVSSRHVAAQPTPQPVKPLLATATATAGAGVMLALPHLDPGHWLTLAAIVLACVVGLFLFLNHKGALK